MNAESVYTGTGPASGTGVRKLVFWLALVLGSVLTWFAFTSHGIGVWPVLNLLLWIGVMFLLARNAFDGWSTALNGALAAAGALLGSLVLVALSVPGAVTLNIATTTGLQYDEARWARQVGDGDLEAVSGASFSRGEVAMLVIRNVSGLAAGPDGRHWLDVDLVIRDSGGNMVQSHQSLLGEQGRQEFPGGVAETPFVFVETADLQPGSYRADVTVHDRIAAAQFVLSSGFTVK